MHYFPPASLLVQQFLHFGLTDGNLPHRIPCNLWHSCALTSPERPDLCHFIIRRALNVTSCVLITPSGNNCWLGTAQKWYIELSSALCKVSEASPCQMTTPGFGTPVEKAAASIHIFTQMHSSAAVKNAVPDVVQCSASPETSSRAWLIF